MKRLAEVFIIWGILAAGGCSDSVTPEPGEPFSMQVIPEQISKAILGQELLFLVTVEEEANGGTPVIINAHAAGCFVNIYPMSINPGEVSEITVIPVEANGFFTVFFRGRRGLRIQEKYISFEVNDLEDQLASTATEIRDKFIPWLEENYTELGITSETVWTGTIVIPGNYEVSYYLFFTEEWEMGVQWHVTAAPDDWARIYLRQRFAETTPSYAFEIPSYSERDPVPYAIDPPESVYR